MKIKLSKAQWEFIGHKTGWLNVEAKKKKKLNPWAVYTKSVDEENKDKFEKCVMEVKEKQNMATNNQHIKTAKEQYNKKPTEHGFMEECIEKNKDKVDDPGAYCASIVDKAKGTTKWRQGPKGSNGSKGSKK